MSTERSNLRSGIVLVAVLWVVVLLAAVAAVIAASSRIESRMCLAETEQTRARWACRAGIEKAIAMLTDDDKATDSLTDIWSDNPDELSDIQLDGCTLTVTITDECGKLNVNAATREQLVGIPGMTDEIADAIVDWRDSDDTEQENGAESGYYLNLKHPYLMRNGDMRTLREVLLAKGMTETMFHGEDMNGNGLLDLNEMDGAATPPNDNQDEVLDVAWKDLLTVYSYENNTDSEGNRRMNINAASQGRLQRSLGLRPAYARWITQSRGNGFNSIGELLADSTSQSARTNIDDANDAVPLDMQTFAEISDRISAFSNSTVKGRVNVNTASRDTLTALFEGNPDLADAVIAARSGLGVGFDSPGAIAQSGAMSVAQFRRYANNMTVRSSVFTIKCTVTSQRTGAVYEAEAVVDRGQDGSPIVYWHN